MTIKPNDTTPAGDDRDSSQAKPCDGESHVERNRRVAESFEALCERYGLKMLTEEEAIRIFGGGMVIGIGTSLFLRPPTRRKRRYGPSAPPEDEDDRSDPGPPADE